jgi:hypothetical protein
MQLKPKIGIDNLKFGMTQKEIYELLGIPNKKRVDEIDSNDLYLEFNILLLRLTIYRNENNRLGYIQTSNPKLEFNNHRIINSTVEFAKKEIFGGIISEWEIDEYDFFSTHGNDDFWITLNVEYGKIISVELGLTFNDKDEFIWPD